MTTLSLSEIVREAQRVKPRKAKVEWLRKNNSKPLRNILKVMYDTNLKLNIPNEAPPYTPATTPDAHGMLYRESRKLVYFVEGYEGDNLSQARREAVFIQMLEVVDRNDAQLLCDVIAQKPLKGLTASVINEALGEIIPTKGKGDDA